MITINDSYTVPARLKWRKGTDCVDIARGKDRTFILSEGQLIVEIRNGSHIIQAFTIKNKMQFVLLAIAELINL